jgi:hypothetical protein
VIFAQAQSASWISFLPSFFQQPAAYFILLVCFATFGLAKSFPKTDLYPQIPELFSIIVGIFISCGLKIGDSYVYASGFGLIAAWGASSFYVLAFTWLTARIRSITGQPADTGIKYVDPNNLPPTK